MRADPNDEPGVVLVYALVMFLAFIVASVIAAGIVIHGGL